MSGEDENIKFLSAYSDLSLVIEEDNIGYYEYDKAYKASITEAVEVIIHDVIGTSLYLW